MAKKGHIPWNKGTEIIVTHVCELCGKSFSRPKRQELKGTKYYCSILCRNRALSYSKISVYRKTARNRYPNRCTVCGVTEHLDIHHRDGNHNNNAIGNLMIVCRKHHKAIHGQLRDPNNGRFTSSFSSSYGPSS